MKKTVLFIFILFVLLVGALLLTSPYNSALSFEGGKTLYYKGTSGLLVFDEDTIAPTYYIVRFEGSVPPASSFFKKTLSFECRLEWRTKLLSDELLDGTLVFPGVQTSGEDDSSYSFSTKKADGIDTVAKIQLKLTKAFSFFLG